MFVGVRKNNAEIPVPAAGGAVPVGVVPQPYLYEPSLTSIQLRQASVAELKKNDAYWEKRLQELETKHKKMYEIMEIEYNKAVGILLYKFLDTYNFYVPIFSISLSVIKLITYNSEESTFLTISLV